MPLYSYRPDVEHYPETSPYDQKPPLYNLDPSSMDEGELDTPELLQAALAIAKQSGQNVLCGMYGMPPLAIMERELLQDDFLLDAYAEPPPLPHITLPDTARFVRQVNPLGNSPVFVVEVENRLCLLKVVSLILGVPCSLLTIESLVSRQGAYLRTRKRRRLHQFILGWKA